MKVDKGRISCEYSALDSPPLRKRTKTNSSILRIGCSMDVRSDAICEDSALPYLDFLADN